MFTLAQHNAWCLNPNGDGPAIIEHGSYCVGVIRRSWGNPSWGASAKAWWAKVPLNERHFHSIQDVPEGAALYAPIGEFHHCWTAARNLQSWTTDYNGKGTFELAPMALPRWTGNTDKVWWTSWSPFGRLPVGKTYRDLHPVVVPKPPAPTAVVVDLRNLKYGVRNNADVKDLQRALNRHNVSPDLPVSGNYLDQTDAAVRACQRRHGLGLDPVRKSFVGPSQAKHLGLKPI